MKTLLRIAALIYPAKWRERYGEEFQCLLEDAQPRWKDVFDILKGGFAMRFAGSSMIRMALTWGLLGALLAGWIAFRLPNRYEARNLMTVAGPDKAGPESFAYMSNVAQRTLSDEFLAKLVRRYELDQRRVDRPYLRVFGWHPGGPQPLGEAMEDLRRDIRIMMRPDRTVRVVYRSNSPGIAVQVTNELTAALTRANQESDPSRAIAIINPAQYPEKPFWPNRPLVFLFGIVGGSLFGAMIALLRRAPMRLAS